MKDDSLKQLMYLEATLAGLLLVLYKGNSFVLVWSTRWYKALSYVLICFFYEYVQANTIHAYYVCDEMATSKECNSTYVRMGKIIEILSTLKQTFELQYS